MGAFFRRLGPGLLYAAGAVGTSHLVQSTRAGADYGLGLAIVIVLIALIKYPGIRFGKDYALATGKTLVHSYASIGHWVTLIYALVILLTMAFVTAALTLVTNGLIKSLVATQLSDAWMATSILILTAVLMMAGKYDFLERFNKMLVPIFTVLIVVATVLVVIRSEWRTVAFALPVMSAAVIMYVVQLAGWLLTPMDGSVLLSLWTNAKARQTQLPPTTKESQFDFDLGYWMSLILALCFLLMGAGVLYGSGIAMASGSGAFATQVIGLFSAAIGQWSFPIIAIIALTVMYSTLLTVMDGHARNLATLSDIVMPGMIVRAYEFAIAIIAVSAVVVIRLFMQSFTAFIDLAGALTFILGPIYAILNHRAMYQPEVSKSDRPTPLMRIWSLVGIIVMTTVAMAYVYLRWIA